MEPTSYDPPSERPVWLGPAIFAAVGLVVVALIAVVHRHGDDGSTSSRTTTTIERSTTTTRPRTGPLGGQGNPLTLGSPGTIDGWTVAVLSPTDAQGAVLASVRLVWNGTAQQAIGDASVLSLHVVDPESAEHDLGGAACPGDPAGALAAVPHLDAGTSDTVPLCWTVPEVDRDTSMLVLRVEGEATPIYFALA